MKKIKEGLKTTNEPEQQNIRTKGKRPLDPGTVLLYWGFKEEVKAGGL